MLLYGFVKTKYILAQMGNYPYLLEILSKNYVLSDMTLRFTLNNLSSVQFRALAILVLPYKYCLV